MISPELPSPAEAGFAKAGNRLPLLGIMLYYSAPTTGLRKINSGSVQIVANGRHYVQLRPRSGRRQP
jgi:hypothetical protein